MSWCDKLAATPSVGFLLNWHIASGDAILDGIAPYLQELVDSGAGINITRHESMAFEFQTHDGFHYAIEPSRVFVEFKHQLRAKVVSAGPPVMQMLSTPQPYTSLLAETTRRLIRFTQIVPQARERSVKRFGIVMDSTIAEEEAPPGIHRFISHVARPWGSEAEGYAISITAKLGDDSNSFDRCIHSIVKQEGPNQLLSIGFDWQRSYSAGRPLNDKLLTELTAQATSSALAYFEDIAEGARFDEGVGQSAEI